MCGSADVATGLGLGLGQGLRLGSGLGIRLVLGIRLRYGETNKLHRYLLRHLQIRTSAIHFLPVACGYR